MKIILAKTAGFCFGVRSAVFKISRILKHVSPVYIDGDLIHNPQTIQALRSRGLINVKNSTIPERSPVAIRTHGTTESDLKNKIASSSKIINLTCSRVSQVQGIIKKNARDGRFAIIAGDCNHPEVISLKSYAQSGCAIVSSPDDLEKLDRNVSYFLVSQTTFDNKTFNEIVAHAKKLFANLHVFHTICDSTYNRQKEVEDAITNGADTLVVIGGKHSANTKSLADIGRLKGAKTIHIETEDDLASEKFLLSKKVFVTAGASTPMWIVDNVIELLWLKRLAKISKLLSFIYLFLSSKVTEITLSALSVLTFSFYYAKTMQLNQVFSVSAFFLYTALMSSSLISEIPFLKATHPGNAKLRKKYLFQIMSVSIAAAVLFAVVSNRSYIYQLVLTFMALSGIVLNMLRYFKYRFIPSWAGSHFAFGAGLLFAMLLSGNNIISAISLGMTVTTMSILLCSPYELMESESDLITGRHSFPSTFGFRVYLIILSSLVIASLIMSYIAAGFTLLFILFPVLVITPFVISWRRPLCPSWARIFQTITGLFFATMIFLMYY